jgi:hypothetical protein
MIAITTSSSMSVNPRLLSHMHLEYQLHQTCTLFVGILFDGVEGEHTSLPRVQGDGFGALFERRALKSVIGSGRTALII